MNAAKDVCKNVWKYSKIIILSNPSHASISRIGFNQIVLNETDGLVSSLSSYSLCFFFFF